ncbi:hypothetical protein LCGC14_1116920 [marine sediment metagenome]|uniref:Uncharacterized protein n=1 Tax=marine sediment metagenome TaxID=412755 RepID=A0A0F9M509_9ZZZZ
MTIGGNIFKGEISPETEAKWEAIEKVYESFYKADTLEEKRRIVAENPEMKQDVICEACEQILDSGEYL